MVEFKRIEFGNYAELNKIGFFKINHNEQLKEVYNFLTKTLGKYEFEAYGFQLIYEDFYIIYKLKRPIPIVIKNMLIQTDGLPYTKVLFVRSSVGTLPQDLGIDYFQWWHQIKAAREQLTEDLKEK